MADWKTLRTDPGASFDRLVEIDATKIRPSVTWGTNPGMVIALEPKLVFPGKGVVGVENTHVVTPEGLRPLTTYPQEIDIL